MTAHKFTHPDKAPEGQEYETECGNPVWIYNTDTGDDNRIHGAYWNAVLSRWMPTSWFSDGQCTSNWSRHNLRDKPRKIKGWVNVYRNRCYEYPTKELADADASLKRIACVPIEYTEGEGLE